MCFLCLCLYGVACVRVESPHSFNKKTCMVGRKEGEQSRLVVVWVVFSDM